MSGQQGLPAPRNRALLWAATAVTLISALFLVTGLLVPGFMLDESESKPTGDDAAPRASRSSERPWAQLNPSDRRLTPDGEVRRLVTLFVGGLNAGRAADAVEMLCPDKRRLIRGSVVWTARHHARLRVTTTLPHAARPGYITIRFAGPIEGRPRRGVIGLDADRSGRPQCVSTFYSIG